jgi:hypothetical protein
MVLSTHFDPSKQKRTKCNIEIEEMCGAWCRPPGDTRHVKQRERVPRTVPHG